MSRRVAANGQTIKDDHALQAYFDEIQNLLLDTSLEMQFVSSGVGARLKKTPPNHAATGRQIWAAANSVKRDLKNAAAALAAASALIARADAVHTSMFLKKRRKPSERSQNKTAANRNNNQSAA